MRDSIEKIAGSARAPLTHDERGAALITVLLFAVLMPILITTMLGWCGSGWGRFRTIWWVLIASPGGGAPRSRATCTLRRLSFWGPTPSRVGASRTGAGGLRADPGRAASGAIPQGTRIAGAAA